MASQATLNREPPAGARPPVLQWDEPIIERQIRCTSRQVKRSDLSGGLLGSAAGVLGYLLLGTFIDHWIAAEGLGFTGRVLLFAGLVSILAVFAVFQVVPAVLRPINPAYAAQTIEQAAPTLRNGLINLVLLKRQPEYRADDPVERHLLAALERRTAAQIAQATPELTVDHSAVVRNGVLLVAAVAAASFYLILSPKNPLASFGRICWPWAAIPVPTRVTIAEVRPGDAVLFQGDQVVVSAVIRGLRSGDSPCLYYTAADGTRVDEPLPMALSESGYRHQCRLPPGDGGLQHSLEYYLAAGDCRTASYRIEVEPALAMTVERIQYDYPDYTGLPDRTAWRIGDVRAVEGTTVTIHAVANRPIRRAAIELDGQPTRHVPMQATGQTTAAGKLVLGCRPEEPGRNVCQFYQLRFTDTEGRENRKPVRYPVEAIADQPPVVQMTLPGETNRLQQVVRNGYLEIHVHAQDPDFGLRRVLLHAECRGQRLEIAPLLERSGPSPGYTGPWEAAYRFRPAAFGLQPQDRVTMWAEAIDGREPNANRTVTVPRTVVVVGADPTWTEAPDNENTQPGPMPGDSLPAAGGPDSQAQSEQEAPPGAAGEESGRTEPQQPSPAAEGPDAPAGQQLAPQPSDPEDTLNLGGLPQQAAAGDTQPQQQNTSASQAAGGQSAEQQRSGPPGGTAGGQSTSGQQQSGQSGQPGDQSGSSQAAGQPSTTQGSRGGEQNTGRSDGGVQSDASQAGAGNTNASSSPSDSAQGVPLGQGGAGSTQPGSAGANQHSAAQPGATASAGETQPGGESGQSGSAAGSPPSDRPENARLEPVDPRTDPGEAFERILDLLAERGVNLSKPNGSERSPDPRGQQSLAQAGEAASGRESSPMEQQPGDSGAPDSGTSPGPAEPPRSGQTPQGSGSDQSGNSGQGESVQPGPSQGKAGELAAQSPRAESPAGGEPADLGNADASQQSRPDGPESQAAQSQSANSAQSGAASETRTPDGTAGQSSASSAEHPSQQFESGAEQPAGENTAGQTGSGGDSQQQTGREHPAGSSQEQQGESGSGGSAGAQTSPPMPEGANQPRSLTPRPDEQTLQQGAGEPPMSSRSARQSDSQGEGSGDRSGGGEQGGGQKAQQPGPGTAGSHAPADQPGGSTQQAPGDQTGPGDQMLADQPTGRQSGGQPGSGSSRRPDAGHSPAGQPTTSEHSGQPGTMQAASQPQGPQSGGATGNPTAGGAASATAAAAEQTGTYRPEDPNLEYARRATDLVLEYLADQAAHNQPDAQLLDRLGWTADDLRRFYQEWSRLKQQAEQPGQSGREAQRQFNQALDSLGLRPPGSAARAAAGRAQRFGSLQEAGRFEPPPEWADLFHAYRVGVARGER